MTMLGSVLEIHIKHLGGVLCAYGLDFKRKRKKKNPLTA